MSRDDQLRIAGRCACLQKLRDQSDAARVNAVLRFLNEKDSFEVGQIGRQREGEHSQSAVRDHPGGDLDPAAVPEGLQGCCEGPPELAREVRQVIQSAGPGHFLVPFDNYIGGRWARSSSELSATASGARVRSSPPSA